MRKSNIYTNVIAGIVAILSLAANTCWAGGCTKTPAVPKPKAADCNSLEVVLRQLKQRTRNLKSYQCRIEYLVRQPEYESQSLRRGQLYYKKAEKSSRLRINFQTLRQDDDEEQEYIEQYIFDGQWLTRIDYQIKKVEKRQLFEPNEPNEPTEAFDIISEYFPIVGFSKVEDLSKQFEIRLLSPKDCPPDEFAHLHFKVKPQSVYKDDYKSVDFWVDRKLHLPVKIVAVSTEKDVFELRFLDPKVNKKIDNKVFDFKLPPGFAKPEIIPLKKKTGN